MLNTLTIAHNLSESGFKREQAEAIANVVADATQSQLGDLASKDFVQNQINKVRGEISDFRGDIKTEIADVRSEMKTEIAGVKTEIAGVKTEIAGVRGETSGLETRLLRWIVGTGIAVGGLVTAVVAILLSLDF